MAQGISKYKRGILLYLLLLLIGIAGIACKKNFHLDEILTYGLSNDAGLTGSIHPKSAPYTYMPAIQAYKEFMTVQESARFNLKNVWRLQASDVHPPFYYVIIHLISSFFVNSCSKWIGGSVNVVFMLLTFWMFRKILFLFYDDRKENNLMSLLFILLAGMINATVFLRMYIMVMFLVTWCTWWFLSHIGKKLSWKFFAGITIIAFVGALTHYYFLLYLFFISIFWGIYLALGKRFLDAAKYIVSMCIAGTGSWIVFPAMIEHIFLGGYRGAQSFENFRGSIAVYWQRVREFFGLLDMDLFGGSLAVFFCVGLFLFFSGGIIRQYRQMPYDRKWSWILLGGPFLCYFLLVAKIAVFITERYMHPIYAVSVAFFLLSIKGILNGEAVSHLKKILFAFVLGIILFNSWKNAKFPALYLGTVEVLDRAAAYQDVDCLYVYGGALWKMNANYVEMQNYRSVTFFEDGVEGLAEMQDLCGRNEFVLYVADCNAEEIIGRIMELCPQITGYEKIGSIGYSVSFHLFGDI